MEKGGKTMIENKLFTVYLPCVPSEAATGVRALSAAQKDANPLQSIMGVNTPIPLIENSKEGYNDR